MLARKFNLNAQVQESSLKPQQPPFIPTWEKWRLVLQESARTLSAERLDVITFKKAIFC